ncbi:MAG: LTA synthase family protein [Candidatus Rifleibacteriota bacterium]
MKERCSFIIKVFTFWLILFCFYRLLFVAYNHAFLDEISLGTFAGIFLHGLYMDSSATAWITFFHIVLLPVSLFSKRVLLLLNRMLTISLICITSFIAVADMQLFKSWGSRMDSLVIDYIANPNEAFAASSASPIFLLVALAVLIISLSMTAYIKLVEKSLEKLSSFKLIELAVFTFLIAVLGTMGRGGLQPIPINSSFAYFSTHDFANQSAINVSHNFFETIYRDYYKNSQGYHYVDNNLAAKIYNEKYSGRFDSDFPLHLNSTQPNIILIIWESLSADAVETLGGYKGVTPGLEKLIEQGLLFSRIYASGDRTNNGLPAIFSGYPAQPRGAIIKSNRKIAKLPSLSKSLKKAGYHCSFYYGGDLTFDNMKAYLIRNQIDKLIGGEDFPANLAKSQWGAHDHDVFAKLLQDIKTYKSPFFTTILTLSSHEPFDVPRQSNFKESTKESKFKNSLYYTDQTILQFIETLKTMPVYDETLIIITSDHGTSNFERYHRFSPGKNHIPILFLGGALNARGKVIDTIGSQQDLAATILKQLQLDVSDYRFSNNLLSNKKESFAQFFFNDGFTYLNERGYLAFNNSSKSIIHQDNEMTDKDINTAKSIMQLTFNDYLNMK